MLPHAYINEKGIAREAVSHHDIGCGSFSENGLAQTHIKGKVAFAILIFSLIVANSHL